LIVNDPKGLHSVHEWGSGSLSLHSVTNVLMQLYIGIKGCVLT